MKKVFKVLLGLFIALVSFAIVATVALRYLDVILGFFNKGSYIEEECDCDIEEFE